MAAAKASGAVLAWRGSASLESGPEGVAEEAAAALQGEAAWYHGMPGCDGDSLSTSPRP